MPVYGWSGPGEMREITLDRAKPPEVTEPTSSTLPGGPERTRFYKCGVPNCGQKFKKAMILARHFNTNHEDLFEDKDSWRAHSVEVWEE